MSYRRDMSDSEYNLADGYVSVSTDGPPTQQPLSRMSLVTDPSLLFAESLGRNTNSLSLPLARAVSRRERPLSSLIWSGEYGSHASPVTPVDVPFETRVICGLSLAMPGPPAWIAGAARERGTLSTRTRAHPLPKDTQAVRLRRERLRRSVPRSPVLTFSQPEAGLGEHTLLVYHNAIKAEIHGLYLVLSSLECRQLDVNVDDFRAFYAWLAAFGDLVRLYLCAGERFLLKVVDEITDMELRGDLSSRSRMKLKLDIIENLERVESVKRKYEAQPERTVECIANLMQYSDLLSGKLLRYMAAEGEQVPPILATYIHREQLSSIFAQFAEYVLESASAPLIFVSLSRGAAREVGYQKRWLKQGIRSHYKAKRIAPSSVICTKWIRRYQDVHSQYVTGFVQAKTEYMSFYA